MSQAIRFDRLGGPEVLRLEEITDRRPGAGEVSLKIEAVGLNRGESMYYRGFYMEKPQLPSGLGYEAVGAVTAVGAGVDGFSRRPSLRHHPGLFHEPVSRSRRDGGRAGERPRALPGIALRRGRRGRWTQYCTAYGALVPFGKVSRGDFVIITAASSSVGLAAIQIVKAQGGTSIATTRAAAKKERLLALGADDVIVTNDEDLVARVGEITHGKGARIVFDPIGGDGVNALARATANGGAIFLYGMLSGQPTPFPLSIFGRRIAMYGYTFGELRTCLDWEAMKRFYLLLPPPTAHSSRRSPASSPSPRPSRPTGISKATSRSAK